MIEDLAIGILLGCSIVSLSAIIVMGLAPYIDKLNRKLK